VGHQQVLKAVQVIGREQVEMAGTVQEATPMDHAVPDDGECLKRSIVLGPEAASLALVAQPIIPRRSKRDLYALPRKHGQYSSTDSPKDRSRAKRLMYRRTV
jgi:hypothetical protein